MSSLSILVFAALLQLAASACSPSCLMNEVCNARDTCVCNTTMYRGMTISNFTPSVTCNGNGIIVTVNKCFLTALKYNYTDLKVGNSSNATCLNLGADTLVNNETVRQITLSLKSGWCGNVVTIGSSKIYVNNNVQIGVLMSNIITVNPVNFSVSCGYNNSMEVALNVTLNPVTGSTTLPGINGSGSYPLTMAAYRDSNFTIPIEASETVVIGTDIFLGLFVIGPDGDTTVLTVEDCVAVPVNNRSFATNLQLVKNGCAADGGVSATVEENGKSLEARIRISSFKFSDFPQLYIFCAARVCDISSGTCAQCGARSIDSDGTREVSLNIPLEDRYLGSGSSSVIPWSMVVYNIVLVGLMKLF